MIQDDNTVRKDRMYICFHKGNNLVGKMIGLWTLGKYSHTEFVWVDDETGDWLVASANPKGGVTVSKYKVNMNHSLYSLHPNLEKGMILEFIEYYKGTPYDWRGILGQFAWFTGAHDDEKFFCSEFCLNAIDYATLFDLTYNGKSLEKKGYHKFNPSRLFKYLEKLELIDKRLF